MSDFRRLPMGVDPYKPNSARIYNYMLGGKDYYEADREYAERVLKVAPDSKALARISRRFLLAGVKMAAEAGVRQFIDIGAGIPFSPSVHEVARKIDPSARVVSIDFDPVVFAHATVSSSPGDTPMLADLRQPDTIIDRLAAEGLIDFEQPVAFLIVGVLHFIMDDEHPAEIIAQLRAVMAPGSHLILTHASSDSDSNFIRQAMSATRGSSAILALRSRAEIASYVAGFDIVDPGLAPIQDWLDGDSPTTRVEILGCICRKP
ncbi:SAM-dependent methyltransferase [Nocardia sp. CA-128927]|uniref:SAM-dependent methyltransferase n=1 Tax=Nocardia sp. CA-128927 TaxID=3239975 RepID=UPI003D9516F4